MNAGIPQACTVRVAAPDGELRLTARYRPGPRAAAVIAPPHPLYGGSIDNPVVVALAAALARAGVASLAFNYRGVDSSSGVASGALDVAVADYRAALEALAELPTQAPRAPYLATGYSFGAGAALLTALDAPNLRDAVLIAPPLGMLRQEDLAALAGRLLVIVGEDDEYAPRAQLEQLLSVRPDATLRVIAGETHFFHYGGLAELERCVFEQVERWLGSSGPPGGS